MRRTTFTHNMALKPQATFQQSRSLYIKPHQALDMLKQKALTVRKTPPSGPESKSSFSLSLTVDRTALSPCFIASPTPDFNTAKSRKFPFPYKTTDLKTEKNPLVRDIASNLHLPKTVQPRLATLAQELWKIFREKEAFSLEVKVHPSADGKLEVYDARFGFDDAAYSSAGRQEEVHKLRNKEEEIPEEVAAEKDGIVYVKYVPCHLSYLLIWTNHHHRLDGEGSIGTLGTTPYLHSHPFFKSNNTSQRRRSRHEHRRRPINPRRLLRQLPRHRRQSNLPNRQVIVPNNNLGPTRQSHLC